MTEIEKIKEIDDYAKQFLALKVLGSKLTKEEHKIYVELFVSLAKDFEPMIDWYFETYIDKESYERILRKAADALEPVF